MWGRKADSGNTMQCAFCPDCGTRLYHLPSQNQNIVNIKPGSLGDTSWLNPVGNVWTKSAQPWVKTSSTDMNFDAQPESTEPLVNAFMNRHDW